MAGTGKRILEEPAENGKHRAIGENLSREIWRDAMYAVKKDGVFAGYADSIVFIRLHSNGCYVPCKES